MTQRPTPTQLMAGFKSGFSEIVDLVSEASDKTSPWIKARIEKMPKKTQDEIYGRFNEAFNGGLKNAAKGREYFESSLDFPALAQKTTEVADDIELAGKMNKLFSKSAPVLEHYKNLSASARKEIENHLGTPAEKAQPKELQKALVTVFGGMGILDTPIKPEPAKPPQKVLTDDMVEKVDLLANWYKYDLIMLEQAEKEGSSADLFLNSLYPCTQLLVQQKLLANRPRNVGQAYTYDTNPPVKETMLSILESFRSKAAAESIIESIMKDVNIENMGSMERSLLAQYLGLPRHLAHEYVQKYPNCTYGDLGAYLKTKARENNPTLQPLVISFEAFDDLVAREMTWVEQCLTNAMPSDFITLDKLSIYLKDYSAFKREEFLAIYNSFSPTFKRLYKDLLRKSNSTPETGSQINLNIACSGLAAETRKLWLGSKQSMYTDAKMFSSLDFLERVFTSLPKAKSPSARVEPAKTETPLKAETSTEKKILVLAGAYKSDLNTLQLAQQFLKAESRDADYEKQNLLELFKGLSPYAQLLVEQHLLAHYFTGYVHIDYKKLQSMTMEDTVRASMEYSYKYYTATLDGLKKTMLEVLDAFQVKRPRKEIIENIRIEKCNPPVGSYEKLLLKQYLSYPRNLANGLDQNLDSAQFDEHLLKAIREKTIPDTDEYFTSAQDSEKWFNKEYLPGYKAEAMTRKDNNHRYEHLWLYTRQDFSRMDFLDQVISLL